MVQTNEVNAKNLDVLIQYNQLYLISILFENNKYLTFFSKTYFLFLLSSYKFH